MKKEDKKKQETRKEGGRSGGKGEGRRERGRNIGQALELKKQGVVLLALFVSGQGDGGIHGLETYWLFAARALELGARAKVVKKLLFFHN